MDVWFDRTEWDREILCILSGRFGRYGVEKGKRKVNMKEIRGPKTQVELEDLVSSQVRSGKVRSGQLGCVLGEFQ